MLIEFDIGAAEKKNLQFFLTSKTSFYIINMAKYKIEIFLTFLLSGCRWVYYHFLHCLLQILDAELKVFHHHKLLLLGHNDWHLYQVSAYRSHYQHKIDFLQRGKYPIWKVKDNFSYLLIYWFVTFTISRNLMPQLVTCNLRKIY